MRTVADLEAEITDLRDALISMASLQMERRRNVLEVAAMRMVANDTSAPYSSRRVQERLQDLLGREPSEMPVHDRFDIGGEG